MDFCYYQSEGRTALSLHNDMIILMRRYIGRIKMADLAASPDLHPYDISQENNPLSHYFGASLNIIASKVNCLLAFRSRALEAASTA